MTQPLVAHGVNIVNTTALHVHLIMVKMKIFMFVVFFPTHKRDIVPALKEIIEGSVGKQRIGSFVYLANF